MSLLKYFRYGQYHTPELQAPVAAAAVLAGAGALATGATITAALIAAGSALVLNGLSAALAPSAPSTDFGSYQSIRSQGIARQIRQPVSERRLVYGEARVSGAICFIGSTSNNKYLHMVIALASHEVQEIGEVYINDTPITDDMLNGSNIVNTGTYSGLIRIKKHLGTAAQTADADLVSEVTDWTTNHRLRGIAYLYVRIEWNRDKFPSGIPNISAYVKGKKCLDTRDTTTRWTPNISLIARDYLVDDLGYQADSADIDTTVLDATANTCDEYITTSNLDDVIESASGDLLTLTGLNDRLKYQLGDRVRLFADSAGLPTGLSEGVDYYVIPYQRKDTPRIYLASSLANAIAGTAVSLSSDGSGTIRKIAEPRYHGGGVIKTNGGLGRNLEEILSGMGGTAVNAGGSWRILAGEYQTPTISFDESDLASSIKTQTKVSRSERFNYVQGVYTSFLNDGNPSDYPAVENSTYQTNDGEVLRRNLDLSFTQRPHTAMRIAKIDLERSRQEIVFTAQFKLTAFKVQVGDNFQFSFERYGWTNKVFEVIDWNLTISDGTPVIEIVARENASAVYDWNSGEETGVDPAANTDLPDPLSVDPPTGLTATPFEVPTAGGDLTYEFEISWTPPANEFVINGGFYEIQFKRSSDATWRRSFRAEDEDTSIRITQVQPSTNYDVRIRSVNSLGVRSAYNSLFGFTVESPSGATIQIDYGLITGAVSDSIDYDLITASSADDQVDWGDIV